MTLESSASPERLLCLVLSGLSEMPGPDLALGGNVPFSTVMSGQQRPTEAETSRADLKSLRFDVSFTDSFVQDHLAK